MYQIGAAFNESMTGLVVGKIFINSSSAVTPVQVAGSSLRRGLLALEGPTTA